jgi:diaminohydroxyphosphoribosylaminopyrimidine deaminase/5-amino-6-(5-phosphoribosylamino)uracil reductase
MAAMSALEAMTLAIAEAKNGAGFVSPNPLVGCVILDKNRELLATGFHARYGEGHAEVGALAKVSEKSQLEGAHVYVTLEPCAHEGKTGSCAKALAKLPLASVTYGLIDPFPQVSGKGARIVADAGIAVAEFSELKAELEELAEIFLLNQRAKRPFVALKVASSLDGKIALEDGSSQWITGETARQHVQSLRGEYDAILVGAGTIHKDDPRLNARDPRFQTKAQRLVILDPRGELAATLARKKLLTVRAAADVFWITGPGVKASVEGLRHLILPAASGEFELRSLLDVLWNEGLRSVFVEGGGTTYAGFLRQRLVDRLYVYIAPKLLGRGLSWTNELVLPDLSRAVGMTQSQIRPLGEDWFFSAKPAFSIT